jgi:hypothetical protein
VEDGLEHACEVLSATPTPLPAQPRRHGSKQVHAGARRLASRAATREAHRMPAPPTEIVASFHDPLEARLACGRLQAEGIAATLGNEQTALANWEWRLALGGIPLRVAARDVARACEVLADLEAGAFALAHDDDPAHHDADPAPADASDPRAVFRDHETASSRLAWLALFLFQVPLPWRRRRRARGLRAM